MWYHWIVRPAEEAVVFDGLDRTCKRAVEDARETYRTEVRVATRKRDDSILAARMERALGYAEANAFFKAAKAAKKEAEEAKKNQAAPAAVTPTTAAAPAAA